MISRMSAARSRPRSVRIWTRSSSGSSSRTSASRSSSRLRATSRRRLPGRSCRTLARSAGRRASIMASRLSTPCSSVGPSMDTPRTADQSIVVGSPRRRNPRCTRPTCSRVIRQSRLRSCSIAASTMVAGWSSAAIVTRRSSSSPITRVSPVVAAWKRRRSSRALTTTWPASMVVTRVIGRKIRRRCTSMTRPRIRGGASVMAQHHHEVAHLAQCVPGRVEHADPGQVRHVDARAAASRHIAEATAAGGPAGGATPPARALVVYGIDDSIVGSVHSTTAPGRLAELPSAAGGRRTRPGRGGSAIR